VKYVNVELLGIQVRQIRRFDFLANVPDLNVDYTKSKRKSRETNCTSREKFRI
jgi:hypothetical protein